MLEAEYWLKGVNVNIGVVCVVFFLMIILMLVIGVVSMVFGSLFIGGVFSVLVLL